MQDERQPRSEPSESYASMAEAAIFAYLQTVGPATTISEAQRNEMADLLARMVTLYSLSGDGSARALDAEEVRDGQFSEGGRTLRFRDGRTPISGIAVTRTSLQAAVEAMKRRGPTKSR